MRNGEIRRLRRKAASRRAQRLGLSRRQARSLAWHPLSPTGVNAASLLLSLVAERQREEEAA